MNNSIKDNLSEEYYQMYNARDFYKGTSFKISEWKTDTHYYCDNYIIDFVSIDGCLLACKRSHISNDETKPIPIIQNDVIVGIEVNPCWLFIMGNNGKGTKGEPGEPGLSATIKLGTVTTGEPNTNVEITNSGDESNAIFNFTIPKGEKGEKGEPGVPGEIPSLNATVTNTTSSEVANATVILSDNTFQFTFDLPKGDKGEQGIPGQDGKDGEPGEDGSWIDFKYAKNNSAISAPYINKTDTDPDGWYDIPPQLETGEFLWMSKAKKDSDGNFWKAMESSYWTDPVRISGEQGPTGPTGPAGADGPAGKDGVSGIPGVSIEVRYCKGTESEYVGSSELGSVRNPENWELDVPETDEEYPYIWFIQARIVYSSNDDMIGTISGTWSTPHILSGVNGLDGAKGDPGDKGQIIYPEGIYTVDTVYACTATKAPYVYDSGDGNFYVLNKVGTWQGTLHSNETPSTDTSDSWVKLEAFEALYTKVGIIANGLIGSAVFNNEFIFSQQGTDSDGEPSTQYELFDPETPTGGLFTPNLLLNLLTGECYLAKGKFIIDTDGNLQLNNINAKDITVNNAEITGKGKLGQAIFNGDWMYSQKGVTIEGTSSSDYHLFNPDNPTGGEFIPNIAFNYKTGEGFMAAGKIKFSSSGEVSLDNITATNASIEGKITASSGSVGEFQINNKELTTYNDSTGTLLSSEKIQYGLNETEQGRNYQFWLQANHHPDTAETLNSLLSIISESLSTSNIAFDIDAYNHADDTSRPLLDNNDYMRSIAILIWRGLILGIRQPVITTSGTYTVKTFDRYIKATAPGFKFIIPISTNQSDIGRELVITGVRTGTGKITGLGGVRFTIKNTESDVSEITVGKSETIRLVQDLPNHYYQV